MPPSPRILPEEMFDLTTISQILIFIMSARLATRVQSLSLYIWLHGRSPRPSVDPPGWRREGDRYHERRTSARI